MGEKKERKKYYSTVKRNEILTHGTIQMNLEDIISFMLNETARHNRTNIRQLCLNVVPGVVKFLESKMVGARGWREKWGVSVLVDQSGILGR